MNDLVPVLVTGIVIVGIYRTFELFVRRKERMAIIEKLGEQIKLSEANVDLSLPLFQQSKNASNTNWALKISLLLIGVGLGLIVAYCVEFAATGGDFNYSNNWDFKRTIEIVYFACVAIFGGIGLLAAYFIEQKQGKSKNSVEE